MALVDRYLHAVKFWLPRNQKEDIIAELSEDLRSQIEDKETELGHKLSDDEVDLSSNVAVPPWLWLGAFCRSNH